MGEQEYQDKGLPMTAKWDPARLAVEVAELEALESKPWFPRVTGYVKRSGPGLLQSAMTLGAGSAAASIAAGAYYGYGLLWVQPLAMFLGIVMLGALSNVVLTTGERPYRAFGREINAPIVFFWALGTIMASIIWHFPQYGLAAGATRDLADLAGLVVQTTDAAGTQSFTTVGYLVSFGVGLFLLGLNIYVTWGYGKNVRGIRVYEWFLRAIIALVVVMFGLVVATSEFNWDAFAACHYGFSFPTDAKGIITVLGAIGAAVGINMTFLYPYSLLAKGWGKSHKALARWDLVLSMFLPFVLVTSLVIIAMANTQYPFALDKTIQPVHAAQGLQGTLGDTAGRIIFDIGFIAMTCGAISAHMIVCGFTFCEMLGLEYTTARYRMFTLVPAIGILGVVTNAPFWFPVAASAVCLTMLPIAYIIFLIMNNKKSYIGDATGHGWKRLVFNSLMAAAVLMATLGAVTKLVGVWDKVKTHLSDIPAVSSTDDSSRSDGDKTDRGGMETGKANG